MNRLVLLALVGILGCSTVRITGVRSDDFSITNYASFDFYQVEVGGDAVGENYQTNLDYLKDGIVKQMQLRGLQRDEMSSELLINIGVVVSEEIATRETNFGNPADRVYMGQRNYSWQTQEVEVERYREGAVTLDIVEKQSNKLVWQGTAESILPKKQKNIPELIEDGLEKLFAEMR